MAPKPKPFATEVDLCRTFIAALPESWTAYAETGGHDILLVRGIDGAQIGVEAKLKFNLTVLHQAIEKSGGRYADFSGPDYRAVLVPDGEGGTGGLGAYLALTVIRVRPRDREPWRGPFEPTLPEPGETDRWRDEWWDLCTSKRCALPPYVPDAHHAGTAAPLQLTEWKVKALKLVALLELNGAVTRADFKHLDLDHRRWLAGPPQRKWLLTEEGGLVAGPGLPPFKTQHPKVFAEILADETWRARVLA